MIVIKKAMLTDDRNDSDRESITCSDMSFQSSCSRGKGHSCGRGFGGHRSSGGGRGCGRSRGRGHGRGCHKGRCRGQGKSKANSSNSDVDLQWTDQASDVTIQPFASVPGPTVTLPHSPLQIFLLFFTRAIVDLIVLETNRYAAQCLGNDSWKTCTEEILAYFGFCILMGINKLPDIYITGRQIHVFTMLQ